LLAATDKTRAQLAEALLRRGYETAEVEDALQRAEVLGYLDDRRVARRKAQAELRVGWAGEALVGRLTRAGVEEAVAKIAVQEAITEAGWQALPVARDLVSRRKLSGAKAARFLASRGFEEDVVERVVGLPGE
jgi:SOS response regulatory protein OraA/RecX